MNLTGKGFEVILASGPDHERLTAEIFFDDKFVALVSQEQKLGEFNLELPSLGLDESLIQRKVELTGFQEAITLARKRLTGETR